MRDDDDRGPPLPSELPPDAYARWAASCDEDARAQRALDDERRAAAEQIVNPWPLDRSARGAAQADVAGYGWIRDRGE